MSSEWSKHYATDSYVFRIKPYRSDKEAENRECYSVSFEVWMTKAEILESNELVNHNDPYTGYLKWDGCLEINESLHLCDPADIFYWAGAIEKIYLVAKEYFTHCDYILPDRVKRSELKELK